MHRLVVLCVRCQALFSAFRMYAVFRFFFSSKHLEGRVVRLRRRQQRKTWWLMTAGQGTCYLQFACSMTAREDDRDDAAGRSGPITYDTPTLCTLVSYLSKERVGGVLYAYISY